MNASLALIYVPALAGVACFFIAPDKARRALLVGAALFHTAVAAYLWSAPDARESASAYFGFDEAGLYFLSITSALFLAVSVYAAQFLAHESTDALQSGDSGPLFLNQPERFFTAFLLFFLAAMTAVAASRHLGLLWIAVESTTLVSAPLIYFHRRPSALEAMWKYLLICSVGIALALLGVFSFATAATQAAGGEGALTLDGLIALAPMMDRNWLIMAFVFLFVGYGTKMGLAPFHMWLPEAHGESPSAVSALLSGALLNCAFLGILRAYQVLLAAGLAPFAQKILMVFGLFSMFAAAVFIVRQTDYKRLLAFSSVEHMGIMAFGMGVGGAGVFGAALHAAAHSLVKAALFMTAGAILARFATKECGAVRGAIRDLPASGLLWVGGFLAITGAPPFATFLSEFTILKAAIDQGHPWAAALYLLLLAVIFMGMIQVALNMAYGAPSVPGALRITSEPPLTYLPPLLLLMGALALGVWPPVAVMETIGRVAGSLGGGL